MDDYDDIETYSDAALGLNTHLIEGLVLEADSGATLCGPIPQFDDVPF